MRTDFYRRIVDESDGELTPAESWVLSRLATVGTLEQTTTRNVAPEEVAGLTARLVQRGYLTIDASGGLELSERGRQVYDKLVDVGRTELTRLIADVRPPDGEVGVVLRRLAVSLLADMPREAPAVA